MSKSSTKSEYQMVSDQRDVAYARRCSAGRHLIGNFPALPVAAFAFDRERTLVAVDPQSD